MVGGDEEGRRKMLHSFQYVGGRRTKKIKASEMLLMCVRAWKLHLVEQVECFSLLLFANLTATLREHGPSTKFTHDG